MTWLRTVDQPGTNPVQWPTPPARIRQAMMDTLVCRPSCGTPLQSARRSAAACSSLHVTQNRKGERGQPHREEAEGTQKRQAEDRGQTAARDAEAAAAGTVKSEWRERQRGQREVERGRERGRERQRGIQAERQRGSEGRRRPKAALSVQHSNPTRQSKQELILAHRRY